MNSQLLRLMYACVLLSFSASAIAQPVVTRSDFESFVGPFTSMSFSADLTTDAGSRAIAQDIIDNAVGANQTYDLTGMTWAPSDTSMGEFTVNVAGLPGATRPEFASANLASVGTFDEMGMSGTLHQFIELRDGAYLRLGTWIVTPDSSFGQFGTPPDSTYAIPLTDGTSWSSSGFQTFVSPSGSFPLPRDTTTYVVEGYGTLMLPGGLNAEALRIRSDKGFGFFSSTTYEFFTTTGLGASIFVTTSFAPPFMPAPSSASYSDVQRSSVGVDGRDDLPESIALGQNYPNPFNPATVIPFELKTSGHASLKIYDTLGREVAVLIDDVLPAGTHSVGWESLDLPSGGYFYTLTAGDEAKTRSLMLLK